MKRLAFTPVVVLLLSLSGAMSAAEVPDRPHGVAASEWIPVSERVGIVLIKDSNHQIALEPTGLYLRSPVNGYFMIKGASGWTRLVIVEPTKGPGDVG